MRSEEERREKRGEKMEISLNPERIKVKEGRKKESLVFFFFFLHLIGKFEREVEEVFKGCKSASGMRIG